MTGSKILKFGKKKPAEIKINVKIIVRGKNIYSFGTIQPITIPKPKESKATNRIIIIKFIGSFITILYKKEIRK
jgi:hypothetical protein